METTVLRFKSLEKDSSWVERGSDFGPLTGVEGEVDSNEWGKMECIAQRCVIGFARHSFVRVPHEMLYENGGGCTHLLAKVPICVWIESAKGKKERVFLGLGHAQLFELVKFEIVHVR